MVLFSITNHRIFTWHMPIAPSHLPWALPCLSLFPILTSIKRHDTNSMAQSQTTVCICLIVTPTDWSKDSCAPKVQFFTHSAEWGKFLSVASLIFEFAKVPIGTCGGRCACLFFVYVSQMLWLWHGWRWLNRHSNEYYLQKKKTSSECGQTCHVAL